jgi:hypothetical protein
MDVLEAVRVLSIGDQFWGTYLNVRKPLTYHVQNILDMCLECKTLQFCYQPCVQGASDDDNAAATT